MKEDSADAILRLIEKDCYNMTRPDTYVIKDLIEVIRNMNYRIKKLEKRRTVNEESK